MHPNAFSCSENIRGMKTDGNKQTHFSIFFFVFSTVTNATEISVTSMHNTCIVRVFFFSFLNVSLFHPTILENKYRVGTSLEKMSADKITFPHTIAERKCISVSCYHFTYNTCQLLHVCEQHIVLTHAKQ